MLRRSTGGSGAVGCLCRHRGPGGSWL